MKNKKRYVKKLQFKKETVADLSVNEMKNSLAGEAPTQAGMSCITDIVCCVIKPVPKGAVRGLASDIPANCMSVTPFCESVYVIC